MSAAKTSVDSNGADAVAAQPATKRLYPKTHANYWKARLEHWTYSRDDKTFEVAEWSVRIHSNGIRKSFDLETANKEEAAGKARDIYLSILAKGWSATIKELAPEEMRPIETNSLSATVGEFLAEVERTANLNPVAAKCHTNGFLLGRQHCGTWGRSHGGTVDKAALFPLRDGFGINRVSLGQPVQALLTMLYRSTHRRCRAGAAV